MKIFIVVGMPASGKNIARIYADEKKIPYYATGDLVREEVRRRGLEPDAANTASVSDNLRGVDGMGVTRLALASALKSGADILFMEGMRSQPEIELIRSECECAVIAFLAPRSVRRERIVSRGRPDDSAQSFDSRDLREIEYGTAIPISLADAYILNTGTMEQAVRELDDIVAYENR